VLIFSMLLGLLVTLAPPCCLPCRPGRFPHSKRCGCAAENLLAGWCAVVVAGAGPFAGRILHGFDLESFPL
jgi:hypothetical protein